DEHGAEIRYVSGAFSDAERKTDVEVELIYAKIDKASAGKAIYDWIPFVKASEYEGGEALDTALLTQVKSWNIADKLGDIERLVAEYETACELARDTFEAVAAKQSFYSYISTVNKREGEVTSELYSIEPNGKIWRAEDLNEELDGLRRGYWALI